MTLLELHVHDMVKELQEVMITNVTTMIQSQFKILEERLTAEMKKKDDRIAQLEAELLKMKSKANDNSKSEVM